MFLQVTEIPKGHVLGRSKKLPALKAWAEFDSAPSTLANKYRLDICRPDGTTVISKSVAGRWVESKKKTPKPARQSRRAWPIWDAQKVCKAAEKVNHFTPLPAVAVLNAITENV